MAHPPSESTPDPSPKPEAVLIVEVRPSRFHARLIPPLLLIALAAGLILWRVRTPDWHWSAGPRPSGPPAADGSKPEPPPQSLALNDAPPAPEAEPAEEPEAPAEAEPKGEAVEVPVAPAEGSDAAEAPKDDFQAEADRIRAEREEMERLKKEEGERLEREQEERQAQPFGAFAFPPGFAFGPVPDRGPGDLQALRRRMEEHRREVDARMEEMRKFHDRMMERQRARLGAFAGAAPVTPRPGESFSSFQRRVLEQMQRQMSEMDQEMRRHMDDPPDFAFGPSSFSRTVRIRRTPVFDANGQIVGWNVEMERDGHPVAGE